MKFIALLSAALVASTVAYAEPTDEQVNDLMTSVTKVVDCQVVGLNLFRLNVTAFAALTMLDSDNVDKDAVAQAGAQFLEQAHTISDMLVTADKAMTNVYLPRAKEFGLDPAKLQSTKKEMLDEKDSKMITALSRLTLRPQLLPKVLETLATKAQGCTSWLETQQQED